MTITFKQISSEDFLGVKNLQQYQRDVLQDYLGTVFKDKPFVNHYGRKAWESKYDPKFSSKFGTNTPAAVPDASSLPDKKWVKRRLPKDRDEAFQFAEECDAWLKDNKVKYQTCLVKINGEPTWVHLFKKTKDALMFKLTWG